MSRAKVTQKTSQDLLTELKGLVAIAELTAYDVSSRTFSNDDVVFPEDVNPFRLFLHDNKKQIFQDYNDLPDKDTESDARSLYNITLKACGYLYARYTTSKSKKYLEIIDSIPKKSKEFDIIVAYSKEAQTKQAEASQKGVQDPPGSGQGPPGRDQEGDGNIQRKKQQTLTKQQQGKKMSIQEIKNAIFPGTGLFDRDGLTEANLTELIAFIETNKVALQREEALSSVAGDGSTKAAALSGKEQEIEACRQILDLLSKAEFRGEVSQGWRTLIANIPNYLGEASLAGGGGPNGGGGLSFASGGKSYVPVTSVSANKQQGIEKTIQEIKEEMFPLPGVFDRDGLTEANLTELIAFIETNKLALQREEALSSVVGDGPTKAALSEDEKEIIECLDLLYLLSELDLLSKAEFQGVVSQEWRTLIKNIPNYLSNAPVPSSRGGEEKQEQLTGGRSRASILRSAAKKVTTFGGTKQTEEASRSYEEDRERSNSDSSQDTKTTGFFSSFGSSKPAAEKPPVVQFTKEELIERIRQDKLTLQKGEKSESFATLKELIAEAQQVEGAAALTPAQQNAKAFSDQVNYELTRILIKQDKTSFKELGGFGFVVSPKTPDNHLQKVLDLTQGEDTSKSKTKYAMNIKALTEIKKLGNIEFTEINSNGVSVRKQLPAFEILKEILVFIETKKVTDQTFEQIKGRVGLITTELSPESKGLFVQTQLYEFFVEAIKTKKAEQEKAAQQKRAAEQSQSSKSFEEEAQEIALQIYQNLYEKPDLKQDEFNEKLSSVKKSTEIDAILTAIRRLEDGDQREVDKAVLFVKTYAKGKGILSKKEEESLDPQLTPLQPKQREEFKSGEQKGVARSQTPPPKPPFRQSSVASDVPAQQFNAVFGVRRDIDFDEMSEQSDVGEEELVEEPNKFQELANQYMEELVFNGTSEVDLMTNITSIEDVDIMKQAILQASVYVNRELVPHASEDDIKATPAEVLDIMIPDLEERRQAILREGVVAQDDVSQDQGGAVSGGSSEIGKEKVDPILQFDSPEIRVVFTTPANRVVKEYNDRGELNEAKANEAGGQILTVVVNADDQYSVKDAEGNELPEISALFAAASKHKDFEGLGTDLFYIAEEDIGLAIDFLEGSQDRFCISYVDSEGNEYLLNADGVAAYGEAIKAKFQAEEVARQEAEAQRLAEAEAQRLAQEKAKNIQDTFALISNDENFAINEVAVANKINPEALKAELEKVKDFSDKQAVLKASIDAILKTQDSSLNAELQQLQAARSLDVNSYQKDTYSVKIEGLGAFAKSKYTTAKQKEAIARKIEATTKAKADIDQELAAYSTTYDEYIVGTTYKTDKTIQSFTSNILSKEQGGKSSLSFYEIEPEVIEGLQATNRASYSEVKKAEDRFEALKAGQFKIIYDPKELPGSNVEKFRLYDRINAQAVQESGSPYFTGDSQLKSQYLEIQQIAQEQIQAIQAEASQLLGELKAKMQSDIGQELVSLNFANKQAATRQKKQTISRVDGYTNIHRERITNLKAILGDEVVSQSIEVAQAALKQNIKTAYDSAEITSPVQSSRGTPRSALETSSSMSTPQVSRFLLPNAQASFLAEGQPKLSALDRIKAARAAKQAQEQAGGFGFSGLRSQFPESSTMFDRSSRDTSFSQGRDGQTEMTPFEKIKAARAAKQAQEQAGGFGFSGLRSQFPESSTMFDRSSPRVESVSQRHEGEKEMTPLERIKAVRAAKKDQQQAGGIGFSGLRSQNFTVSGMMTGPSSSRVESVSQRPEGEKEMTPLDRIKAERAKKSEDRGQGGNFR